MRRISLIWLWTAFVFLPCCAVDEMTREIGDNINSVGTNEDDGFTCDHFNAPDVMKMSLRLPPTRVPAEETTYICFRFRLPDDQAYHIIGTRYFVDNIDLVHHMGLEACPDSLDLMSKPGNCASSVESQCNNVFLIYNQGMKGQCLNPAAGLAVGKGGRKVVNLQMHWTNPKGLDNLVESAGFEIYYTPKLRPNTASVFTIGQERLDIPPGRNSVLQSATCTSRCTRYLFRGPVYVISALNHMHYLGFRENVTLIRQETPVMTMTNDEHYKYGTPKLYQYDPPVMMKAGDEIKIFCDYRSTSRNTTTHFGLRSQDEMCYVYMTFYPAENINLDSGSRWKSSCLQHGKVDTCEKSTE